MLMFCPAGLETCPLCISRSALLPSGWADDVQVVVTDGTITKVTIGATPGTHDERHQLAIPGIASLHSHAFQRGMAGLAETRGNTADTFWTWRETMYRFALDMTPEDTEAVATLLYVEMLEQGLYARRGIPLSPSRPRRQALCQPCGDGDANCASRRDHRHRAHSAAEFLRAQLLWRRRTTCRPAPVHLLDRPVRQADCRHTDGRPRIARGQCRCRSAQPAGRNAGRIGGNRATGRSAGRFISMPPNRSGKSRNASPGRAGGRSSGCSNMRPSISAGALSMRPI